MSVTVVGIGELLWDLLPSGAEVGGAPANFAFHAQSLGARSHIISRVGDDPPGLELLARVDSMSLPRAGVQIDGGQPTGTVGVTLGEEGIPRFEIRENCAWDRLMATTQALATVREADAICFGSLAQRDPVSRASIRQLLAHAPEESMRIFDINLRQHFHSPEVMERSLELANVVKLNDDELSLIASTLRLPGDTRRRLSTLAEAYRLNVVVLTLGARGSIVHQGGQWSELPAPSVNIVDTVGAGDAFTAALTVGMLHGMELHDLHAFASDVSGYVCSQRGATPPLPHAFRARLSAAAQIP
jgi:fructokinase